MKQFFLIGLFIISTSIGWTQNNELLGAYKVIFIGENNESAKHRAVLSGITETAKALAKTNSIDIEILDYSPNNVSIHSQSDALLESFLSNADAIIISPTDSNELRKTLALYKGYKKEVLFIEESIESIEALLNISTDEHKAGEMAAQAILKHLPTRARVAILTTEKPADRFKQRLNGVKTVLGYKRIETIVYTEPNYKSALAKVHETMEADENRSIKAWIFLEDWALQGASNFPWEPNTLAVVSIVSSPISYLSYDLNYVSAFVQHPYFQWGATAIQTLINKLYKGETPELKTFKTEPFIVNWENIHLHRQAWDAWLN